MVHLDLTNDEKKMLAGVLNYYHRELHNEISNTENWEFKDGLKKKEELVKKVLAVLEAA